MEYGELSPRPGDSLPRATNEAAGVAYALGAIAHVLAEGGDPQTAFPTALEHLREGLDLAAVALLLGEGQSAATMLSHRPGLAGLHALATTGRDLAASVSGGPVLSFGGGSGFVALPVRAQGRNYGVIWAARDTGVMSKAQTAALSAAAAQFGLAMALRHAERRPTWDEASAGAAWAMQARRRTPGELPPLVEPLSEREIEVLRDLAAGQRNRQIAERLHISENTVKFHIQNIFQKLGVANRTAATAAAQERGLLD